MGLFHDWNITAAPLGEATQYRWARHWLQGQSRPPDNSPAYTISRVFVIASDDRAEALAAVLKQDVKAEHVASAQDAHETLHAARCVDLPADLPGDPATDLPADLATVLPTDLVVLDMPAPAMLDRVAELAGAHPGIPVLVVASSRGQGIQALAHGAHAFAVRDRLDKDTLLDAACMAVEVHRARRDCQAQNERLIHADRLVALGQLTAGVVHEITNPAALLLANLTTMQAQLTGLCSAVRGRGAPDSMAAYVHEWAEILNESVTGVEHIHAIVKDLRNFSRPDTDDLAPVDVVGALETACKLTEALTRRRARLVKDVHPVPLVKGDHGKLVQVFTNLLTNAAQAIEGPWQDNEIRVLTSEREGKVVVAVEDTGCGIPEAIGNRVFEPFFTTKPRDTGTGLGLALSAEIVHRCGGDIGFTATPGRGTRFEVCLCVHEHPARSLPPSLPPSLPTSLAGGRSVCEPRHHVQRSRVLLVDDEPSLLRAFRRVLAPRHDVVMAANGQQALDILERDTNFDGVICDFTLPDLDGICIYETVARRDSELADRIVFCTGGPMSHRSRTFIESTTNTVLEKPVPPELLLGAIEQLGKR